MIEATSPPRASAFAAAHRWQPEPAPEAPPDPVPATTDVALRLLHQIAEDPMLRPSYRVAARRHLRRLAEAEAAAAEA
ncbi:MAG TPA: hypothetical protein VND19_18685 [Acetobacteraceae bacterium]|nr:hypothetical protein [Acetobacteraceae bacterium]